MFGNTYLMVCEKHCETWFSYIPSQKKSRQPKQAT